MSSTPSATSPNACSMASAENWRFCLRKIGLKRLICWLKRAPSERLRFVAQRRAEVMEEPPLRLLVRLLAHKSEHVAQIDVLRLNAQARLQRFSDAVRPRRRHQHARDRNGAKLAIEVVQSALHLHREMLKRDFPAGRFIGKLLHPDLEPTCEVELRPEIDRQESRVLAEVDKPKRPVGRFVKRRDIALRGFRNIDDGKLDARLFELADLLLENFVIRRDREHHVIAARHSLGW